MSGRHSRNSLLAMPKKSRITQKYELEPEHKWKAYKRPLKPLKNKRLDMLSVPNRFHKSSKYETPEEPSTTISRAVLEAPLTPRLDHLSRPFVVKLQATKQQNRFLGKSYMDVMNEKIAMSWDTIYYFNRKTLMNMEHDKRKTKSLPTLKKRVWGKEDDDRMVVLARPRPIPKPRRGPKRKRAALEKLLPRIKEIAVPSHPYRSPSQDSFLKQLYKVSPAALVYQASDRTKELAKLPACRLVREPPISFAVKRGALHAKMTERLEILAAARPRANAPEMDLKEKPYEISPNALKYKATERIINLAKPVER